MDDLFTLTLNSPITEEQWDAITDVDFDHTDRIFFHTKHGKEVEFAKVVRCKDCKHRDAETGFCEGRGWPMQLVPYDGFCDKGERREDG